MINNLILSEGNVIDEVIDTAVWRNRSEATKNADSLCDERYGEGQWKPIRVYEKSDSSGKDLRLRLPFISKTAFREKFGHYVERFSRYPAILKKIN